MQKSDRAGERNRERKKEKVIHIEDKEKEKLIKYNRILFGGTFLDLRGNVFLNNIYIYIGEKKLQKNRYISRITKKNDLISSCSSFFKSSH